LYEGEAECTSEIGSGQFSIFGASEENMREDFGSAEICLVGVGEALMREKTMLLR